jgi:uncharacterized protein YukE
MAEQLIVTPDDVRAFGGKVAAAQEAVADVRPDAAFASIADAVPGGALAVAGTSAARVWSAETGALADALAAISRALTAGATTYDTTEHTIAAGFTTPAG